MLLKCMYENVFLWNDDFTQKVIALKPEYVVLELDEKPRSRGVGSGPYVKVLRDGHTGWVLYERFEELTEPARAKNKKRKSAKGHVPLP